jgi:hypothetical protein
VEKGLLREVKQVQRIIESLVLCKVGHLRSRHTQGPHTDDVQFYDDNLQDENTVLAFRMLVKDLLVLFQAGNEGVCNVLGMSARPDSLNCCGGRTSVSTRWESADDF